MAGRVSLVPRATLQPMTSCALVATAWTPPNVSSLGSRTLASSPVRSPLLPALRACLVLLADSLPASAPPPRPPLQRPRGQGLRLP